MSELPDRDEMRRYQEKYGEASITVMSKLWDLWLAGRLKSRDEMKERRAFWMLAHHRDRSDITPIEKMELALDAAWGEVADETR